MAIDHALPAAYQEELLARIHRLLERQPAVEAAWLSGSLGRGAGDEFSDVDVLALAAGEWSVASKEVARAIEATEAPVLLNALFGGRVLGVVTGEWHRFDVSFVEGAELSRYNANALRALFNRGRREPPAHPPGEYHVSPGALLQLVQEFLRVLGLAVVCAGRGELVLMLDGIGLLRRMTVDLMLEENRVPAELRGGALHRNPLLTAEQRAALEAAPPLVATRDSALEGVGYFAAVFLPRARLLAEEVGLAWPHPLEDATRRSLDRHLGFRLP